MTKVEDQRVKAVKRFLDLKISRETELQGIVEMAAEICRTPVAMITFTDTDTQFVKYKTGIDIDLIKRDDTFCHQILNLSKPLVIHDLKNSEFSQNPYVKVKNGMRFYAGAPITTYEGLTVGTLCVLDVEPRTFIDKQMDLLSVLARQIITILEFDLSIDVLKAQYVQVKESENKLRSFFDSSLSCHFLLDKDMYITAFNKTAAKFVKTNLNVKLKPGILMTDHISRVEYFKKNFAKALSGKVVRVEMEVPYKDITVWWGIVYEPAYDSEGHIIGVSYNATDITEAKTNQLKLSAQSEALRNIAFIQSHELRRPVASILGLMYLIKLESYKPDRQYFDLLEHATKELDEKIQTIIDQVYMH